MVLSSGDPAPDFTYTDRDGRRKDFHQVTGKKIIFFYPKAFTAGCTAEACSIQDSYEDLKQGGITEVFGISLDNNSKQDEFKEQFGLEYILVSDDDGSISKAYGVYKKRLFLITYSSRFTFIVNEENRIIEVLENGLSGNKSKYGLDKHGQELLELITLDDQ
jgi:peroxiredoxin Q/BCP